MAKLTDNSFFREKVKLRIDNLPEADPVNVLDAYHGSGRIWDEIVRKTGRRINVLGIEKKRGTKRICLQGDNRKFRVDYDQFNLVDLDAYGVPYAQLEDVFKRTTREIGVFITFNQTVFGILPEGFLAALGYPPAMVKKCPSLFTRDGQRKMLAYLAQGGVRRVKIYSTKNMRKNYIYFRTAAKKEPQI